jgi:Tfp pilus assembly protein PilX
MEKRTFHFGFSTIMIAFVMICIVTFCALALLTANADYRLSRKVADRTSAYYEAEKSAYETLSEIDELLAESYRTSSSKKTYEKNALAAVSDYATSHPDITVSADTPATVAWDIPFSDTQTLSIALTICYPPENDDCCYTLDKWNTTSAVPESAPETLDLIGKEITYER